MARLCLFVVFALMAVQALATRDVPSDKGLKDQKNFLVGGGVGAFAGVGGVMGVLPAGSLGSGLGGLGTGGLGSGLGGGGLGSGGLGGGGLGSGGLGGGTGLGGGLGTGAGGLP